MDKGARIAGLATFVVGLVLMAIVFMSASRLLNAKDIPPVGLTTITSELYVLLTRILSLFVMGYIASAVAGRGVQMYQAARGKPALEKRDES